MTRAEALLEAAVWYAEHGIPVLPCHNIREDGSCSCLSPACRDGGKHPRTLHGKDDATTDLEQVRHCWSMFPEANIGARCSAFVVLDVDPRHGGFESLERLEEA